MFTVDQIKQAHSKVRSGADFPAYIKDLKLLGVTHYETYVLDGHTDYFGIDHYTVSAPAKYPDLSISEQPDADRFKAELKSHQQGKTDFPTFSNDCARSGISKWAVSIEAMTCTYYDKMGNEILVEIIPG